MNSNPDQAQLSQARYITLATRKRSGDMVATPVWCAPVNEYLYVFSADDAGKVKRLRNFNEARVAPCTYNGKRLGPWQEATAELTHDADEIKAAHRALLQKYGLQMRVADFFSRLSGRLRKRAFIRIQPR